MIDKEFVTYMFIGCVTGLTVFLYLHFNIKDLITLTQALSCISVGLFVRLLRRRFPNLGGEYVFYYILILPLLNESSRDLKEINFLVENTGKSIHNITVKQNIIRRPTVEKETKNVKMV